MDSYRGQLLIAEPRLPDTNFFRSVVLILDHSDAGASGLILNRPSSVTLDDIWHEVSSTPIQRSDRIYIGGPVEGPLAALHSDGDLGEQTIMDDLHLSIKRDHLDELLQDGQATLRLFSGYSGWGPGQLEREMQAGGWLTWPAGAEYVFADPEQLYKLVCDQVGSDILFGNAPPNRKPSDPSAN